MSQQGPTNCGVYGRAWRERSPYFCVHIAAVNPQPFPAQAHFLVRGLDDANETVLAAACANAGAPGYAVPTSCAMRLFDQTYPVNLTAWTTNRSSSGGGGSGGGRVMTFTDTIAAASSAVYRIGCAVPPLPLEEGGLLSLVCKSPCGFVPSHHATCTAFLPPHSYVY